jgi:hypothetical protein
MLFDRYHPLDIIEYIKSNYRVAFKKSHEEAFIDSLLNPEKLKPKRYISYTPTQVYYDTCTFKSKNELITIEYDRIYDDDSYKTDIKINDKYLKDLSSKSKLIKQYRVTACGIYISGLFKINNEINENKKLVYIPEDVNNMNFVYINDMNSNQNVEIYTESECIIQIIKHIEFIPFDKNVFVTKKQTKDIYLNECNHKYRDSLITNYNGQQFVRKNTKFDES